jgi:hypothetical protein
MEESCVEGRVQSLLVDLLCCDKFHPTRLCTVYLTTLGLEATLKNV